MCVNLIFLAVEAFIAFLLIEVCLHKVVVTCDFIRLKFEVITHRWNYSEYRRFYRFINACIGILSEVD